MKLRIESPSAARARARQRGIVVFVALIAMVVLSLAAVALIRAVDTNSSVAGNLAFRQAANALINTAVEQAADDLFLNPAIADTTNDDPDHNYYATIQARRENQRRSGGVADRQCLSWRLPVHSRRLRYRSGREHGALGDRAAVLGDGDPLVNIGKCDVLVPKVSPGKTTMKGGGPPVNPKPIFRVSVRVDGPSNTIAYAQAQLI